MGGMPPMTPEMLANTPSMPPPNGVVPNFIDPPTYSHWATAVVSVFLVLMLFMLGARLLCRAIIVKHIGIDDWAALGAGVFATSTAAVVIALLNQGGFGPHSWNVPLSAVMKPSFNQNLFVIQLLIPVASGLAKVAILLFFLRIFPLRASPKTAYLIYFGLTLNVLFYVILFIYTCVVCAPRPNGGGQLPAKCDGALRMTLGVACASINAVLDIYVLLVAIPSLWMLQIPTKRKIGVVLILLTGTMSCACSILALYLRVALGSDDPSRRQVLPLVITILEPLIGIITACLPAMPALWVKVSSIAGSSFRNLFSAFSTRSATGASRSGYSQSRGDYELPSRSQGSSIRSLNKATPTVSELERGIVIDTQYTVSNQPISGTRELWKGQNSL